MPKRNQTRMKESWGTQGLFYGINMKFIKYELRGLNGEFLFGSTSRFIKLNY